MPSYQITQPHPTALPNHYIHTGRGGAGNTIRAPSSTSARPSKPGSTLSTTPSRTSSTSPTSPTKASTGRGGAGNIHPHSSLSTFSLSDEMAAQAARECGHRVWHVGRGGAGNFATRNARRRGSEGSVESVRSGFLGRVSGAFERL